VVQVEVLAVPVLLVTVATVLLDVAVAVAEAVLHLETAETVAAVL
jgi:hypothetical protein